MARFTETITDQNGAPQAGARVLVQASGDGSLANLTDDIGGFLPNPITTSPLGSFAFNVDPGLYDLTYQAAKGGRIIRQLFGVQIGSPQIDPNVNAAIQTAVDAAAATTSAQINALTTTNIAEGSRLYFTPARAQAAISGSTTATVTAGVVSITAQNITAALGAAPLTSLGGTITGPLLLTSNSTDPNAAATIAYVQSIAAGQLPRANVASATTGNITLSGIQTIDGVAGAANQRVLVKDQTTASQNGIYLQAAGSWPRASDMDTWSEVPGATTTVLGGTVNANATFTCNSPSGGTLGVTAITFTTVNKPGNYDATGGITKTGVTFSLTPASQGTVLGTLPGGGTVAPTPQTISAIQGFTSARQGGGIGQTTGDQINIGWSGTRVKVTINAGTGSAYDAGNVVFDGDLSPATGAGKVGYRKNFTGAPLRTVNSALQDGVRTLYDFGGVGDGTTDCRAALAAADAIGPFQLTGGLFYVASSITINSDVIVSPGARFVIPNGVIVTFNGRLLAADHQIFNLSGSGNVAGLKKANAAWWVGDLVGTTTDATALLNKIDPACQIYARVDFPKGDLCIAGTTPILFTKGQTVRGAGRYATRILWTTTTTHGFKFTTTGYPSISGMALKVYNDATMPTAGDALLFTDGAFFGTFDDMWIQRPWNGPRHEATTNSGFGVNSIVADALNTGRWVRNTDNVLDTNVIVSAFSTFITFNNAFGFIPGEGLLFSSGGDGSFGFGLTSTLTQIFVNHQNPAIGSIVTGVTSGTVATVTAVKDGHAAGALRLEDRCESYQSVQSSFAGGDFAFISAAANNVHGSRPSACVFTSTFFDNSHFGADIKQFYDFRFVGCWFASKQGNGATIQQCDNLEFNGTAFSNNWFAGALIKASAKNVRFVAGYNRGANVSSSGSPAIYLESNINRVRVQMVNFDAAVGPGGVPTAVVFIEPGTSDYIKIKDNDTFGLAITMTGVTGAHNEVTSNS